MYNRFFDHFGCDIFINAVVIVEVATAQATVTEGERFVQLCFRLAGIGPENTLEKEVTVTLCPIAGSGEARDNILQCYLYNSLLFCVAEASKDFVDQCVTVIFPVGSRHGDTVYANITIIDDKLKENQEIFIVSATITPSSANFGGAMQGSSDNITVTINDDDGEFYCMFYTRYLWCKWLPHL